MLPLQSKKRTKGGYDSTFSDYVSGYDDFGFQHYFEIASELLTGLDLRGKEVLDVGAGTGILSFHALEKGAGKVICGEFSGFMLDRCREKAVSRHTDLNRIDFKILEADQLPFEDNSVDMVMSSMMLGMTPNQEKVLSEMARVLRPGGMLAIATHGPAYYREAIELTLKEMIEKTTLLYFMDHRFEFWPSNEAEFGEMMSESGLPRVQCRRLSKKLKFENGAYLYDFFASTSSLWWFSRYPSHMRKETAQKSRKYFKRKGATR